MRSRHTNFSIHNFDQQAHSSVVVKAFDNSKLIREGTSNESHFFARCYPRRKLHFPVRITRDYEGFYDPRGDRNGPAGSCHELRNSARSIDAEPAVPVEIEDDKKIARKERGKHGSYSGIPRTSENRLTESPGSIPVIG